MTGEREEAVAIALRVYDAAMAMNREAGAEVFDVAAAPGAFIGALEAQAPPFTVVPVGPDFLDGAREQYQQELQVRRLLGYLWTATGFRSQNLAVRDLFDPNDPLVADVERVAILPEPVR